jgi:hypothetical protein
MYELSEEHEEFDSGAERFEAVAILHFLVRVIANSFISYPLTRWETVIPTTPAGDALRPFRDPAEPDEDPLLIAPAALT